MSDDRIPAGRDETLARPRTIRLMWIAALVALALAVIADLFVKHSPYFGIDGVFGFGAWFAVLAGGLLVVVAKLLGVLLQRPDTYYDD